MYRDVDDLLAKTLKKILSTLTMTVREQTLMIFLVSLMKWRIPKIDGNFYELVKDVPIENLGFAFRPINSDTKISTEEINRINDLEVVKETKCLLLPIQPLINEKTLSEIHKNCFIVSHDTRRISCTTGRLSNY